jgi:hypothetical protein
VREGHQRKRVSEDEIHESRSGTREQQHLTLDFFPFKQLASSLCGLADLFFFCSDQTSSDLFDASIEELLSTLLPFEQPRAS